MLDIVYDKLLSWWDQILNMLPNFLLALLALAAFIIGARLARKAIFRILTKVYHNKELTDILSKITYVAIVITGAMVALSILELDKTVTSVLAGAGIVGLALSFAFQDLAANIISGFYMAAKNPFEIGDVIEVKDYIGEVKEIQLRSTLIQTFDGNEVRMPNRLIFENPMTNYYETKTRMVQLELGVSYAEDLDEVEQIN
jgi:small conductance mechanosensitive channel